MSACTGVVDFTAVYPVGTYVRTNEGEIGVILKQNKKYADKPVIKIILDEKGDRVLQELVRNLLTEEVYITEVVEMIQ